MYRGRNYYAIVILLQSGYWGRVEWAHDLSQQQMQSRLAAAVLFVHLNSSSTALHRKETSN